MKKTIPLLLILAMLLACAGCGGHANGAATEPQTQPTETTSEPSVTIPQVMVENPVTYFQMNISYATGDYASLTAYDDGQGMAYVEYVGEVRKVATLDPAVLHAIVTELEHAGAAALDGENLVGDGFDSASMYVGFADESYWGAGYTGFISQEFMDAYEKMEAWFATLLADVPEYVPQPAVLGEVNADVLAEMMEILNRSGMEPLDMFCISDIPLGDSYSAGLSDSDGITNLTSCGPAMMATAYSFVIAAVEDESAIDAVRQDFAAHLDWNRWVCVSANSALIAQKDNLVVCVMGAGELYADTAWAIEAAGWTEIETFKK